jgi:meso-butanediol dehydrogenase / (S,S)-butanediol dehydrogenase / diacetyl reductase
MVTSQRTVTVITGGGTGVGAALARLLSSQGHDVVIAGRRAEPLEAVAQDTGALVVVGDIATVEGAQALISKTIDAFGKLDNLVLNAGVVRNGKVADLSVEDWNETININLTANFLLSKYALPHLVASKGNIVGVSSIASLRSGYGMSAYAASKSALTSLIQNIAFDYAAEGVRANAVCPGWILTEMAEQEFAEAAHAKNTTVENVFKDLLKFVPQQRASTPDEQAKPIAWLLSDEAAYVNGATLVVDGGTTIVDAGMLNLHAN